MVIKLASICQEIKLRIFVKKASHLPRCVKGTLRDITNVVDIIMLLLLEYLFSVFKVYYNLSLTEPRAITALDCAYLFL